MCGIAGILGSRLEILEAMSARLNHRGPDDSGHWSDTNAGVGLAHRRLSILDLSPAGHQPMASPSSRFVIVYNGEIYNHLEIRKELEHSGWESLCRWRGHSDTETLLAGFDAWGIETTLQKSVGMFAMAVWDKAEKTLTLARDRFGEKPLYYGWSGNTFLFGSELKALRAHPCWHGRIDRDALALYFRHNYIPAPYSIYSGIRKLIPGTMLTMQTGSLAAGVLPEPKPYWSMRQMVEASARNPFQGTEREAVDHLENLLSDSIRQQMVADVPLGAFLSGGVDSSTIVALMQAQTDRPVKTFTIGFEENGYNEAEYAKAVARHLRTDHTELYVTPQDALDVIPMLPALYDEPFSDSSQIPTFLVARMTRQHVTVCLSGDAGDELFSGYNRYFVGRALWHRVGWLPPRVRAAMAVKCASISPARWDAFFRILPQRFRLGGSGDKLHKLADVLAVDSPETMYRQLVSHWKDPAAIVPGSREPLTVLTDRTAWPNRADFTERMMYLDTLSYLPDDILVKVDRAAMGVSLETRIPFLDHRVVEFAWQLPLDLKIRHGQGKWILRQVLYRYVPKSLIERPKTGFGIPLDNWLRGPLREWAESLIGEERLRREGFLHHELIRQKWQEHLSGTRNWQYYLWDVLMFQAWLENERR
ncbi:asparagine synthase (glutamine-hydrolyzing) [Geobacter sp.]|uniref:asparagine synthase (glutamine-hydrolyzing) n=1 Tax=Geobacter sp. TaxID=46610 RepID=UPI002604557E|nr:asparagine synthase (glutamine-hydrolyzing) [Geobacter sp.]